MPVDTASVEAKLRRATEHFASIEAIALPWVRGKGFRVTHERNADLTEHSLVFRTKTPLDFVQLSLMFGDFVHNLRSALDHLVYAIAIHKTGQSPPPSFRQLAFPIANDDEAFLEFCNRKLKPLLPCANLIAKLQEVQFYNRPNDTFPPLLKVLREFDDSDKHRLLHLAVMSCIEWEYHGQFGGLPPEAGPIRFIPNDGEISDGSPVVTIITSCPTPAMNLNGFGLLFAVVVDHELAPNGARRSYLDAIAKFMAAGVDALVKEVLAVANV